MKVYIVMTDDCNENDCGCYIESIDSIWLDEEKAKKRAKEVFRGYVTSEEVRN